MQDDDQPKLRVIEGQGSRGAAAERIALTLVHLDEHIDVPAKAIFSIEAHAEFTFVEYGTGRLRSFPDPRVVISLRQDIGQRLYQLTRRIVDYPIGIVVGTEWLLSPIVREPIGADGSLAISANDLAEAEALADRLRTAWSKAGPKPRLVS